MTITMQCHVPNYKDSFNTTVNWMKVDKGKETIISDGCIFINELFRERYFVSKYEKLDDLYISLKIHNVTIRDNGTFKCVAQDVHGGRSIVTHFVFIIYSYIWD